MTALDKARQGRSAARQIRQQMAAGVLTDRELDRLMRKVEEGFSQMMGEEPPPLARGRGFAPVVHDGGRP